MKKRINTLIPHYTNEDGKRVAFDHFKGIEIPLEQMTPQRWMKSEDAKEKKRKSLMNELEMSHKDLERFKLWRTKKKSKRKRK